MDAAVSIVTRYMRVLGYDGLGVLWTLQVGLGGFGVGGLEFRFCGL